METHGGDMLIKTGRSATVCKTCLWPKSADGLVYVPYVISASYNSGVIDMILNAMLEFESLTCIRFIPRTTEKDYLNIVSTSGCLSYVGKVGGAQMVSLGNGCFYRGVVQHELNHAIGFYHEHMRSDRDAHVDIMYQNIAPKDWPYFDKEVTNNLGLEYDFGSVMHYNAYAFSTSSAPSIVTKPANMPIGQRNGLSTLDVAKINRLYQCNVCATLLNEQSGTMTSANYPSAYPNNANCVWLIRPPSGQVSLTFIAFSLQNTPNCVSDYIKVYDGPSRKSPVMLGPVCGSGVIPPLIASSNQMLVEFVSDSSIADVGFKATYSSVPCGGTYFGFIKNFTSPWYPGTYSPNMNCVYTITAPAQRRIVLTITNFHLENSPSCASDSLTINYDSTQKGPFCGDRDIPIVTTTGNTLQITFKTDAVGFGTGFYASYNFI